MIAWCMGHASALLTIACCSCRGLPFEHQQVSWAFRLIFLFFIGGGIVLESYIIDIYMYIYACLHGTFLAEGCVIFLEFSSGSGVGCWDRQDRRVSRGSPDGVTQLMELAERATLSVRFFIFYFFSYCSHPALVFFLFIAPQPPPVCTIDWFCNTVRRCSASFSIIVVPSTTVPVVSWAEGNLWVVFLYFNFLNTNK